MDFLKKKKYTKLTMLQADVPRKKINEIRNEGDITPHTTDIQ